MAKVFVITGPSGVGKGTLIRALRERIPAARPVGLGHDRAPRPGERDGTDYHFLTHERFAEHVAAGDFVEHAELLGQPLRDAALRARSR